jgi:hypothetical protein
MHSLRLPAALLAVLVASPLHAAMCSNDNVPAASLLVPWFEVDDCATPASGATDTRIVVANTGAEARLAHVTLWTNAAVPAYDFDIYLNGYAQQEVGLRALFCTGTLPRTGRGLAPPGERAGPRVSFAGCSSGNANGAAPVYGPGFIPAAELVHLQAWFSGTASPQTGTCGGLPSQRDSEITGYVTVDSVTQCNAPIAGEAGFAAAMESDNALAGRVTVENGAQNSSFGYAAVALEATTGGELAGSRSFYDFDAGGGGQREPLASAWGVDYSPSNSEASLVIWRGTGRVGAPFGCSAKPPWYPLDFSNTTGFSTRGAFVVSDNASADILQRSPPLASLATQRVAPLHGYFGDGYVRLNLQHSRLPGNAFGGQAWVMRVDRSPGRFEREEPGSAYDSGCSSVPFNHVSPGPGAPL